MTRLILCICLMSVAATSHAQIPLGFKTGVNTNTIVVRGDMTQYWENSNPGVSLHLGVFSKVKLSGKFNFIPELQFIQKQSSFSGQNLRFSYVELPLLISYRPFKWLNIEAGPSVGLNIGSNLDADAYKKADCGILGGLRFNITSRWSILGRYYYGVTPIEKAYFRRDPVAPPRPEVLRYYNQGFQFSIAYYLKRVDS